MSFIYLPCWTWWMFNWGPGQHVEQETSRRKIVQDVGSDNQCPKAGAYARNYVSRPGRNRGNVHWTGMDLVHQSLPLWRGCLLTIPRLPRPAFLASPCLGFAWCPPAL